MNLSLLEELSKEDLIKIIQKEEKIKTIVKNADDLKKLKNPVWQLWQWPTLVELTDFVIFTIILAGFTVVVNKFDTITGDLHLFTFVFVTSILVTERIVRHEWRLNKINTKLEALIALLSKSNVIN
jgi:hypothetical protein